MPVSVLQVTKSIVISPGSLAPDDRSCDAEAVGCGPPGLDAKTGGGRKIDSGHAGGHAREQEGKRDASGAQEKEALSDDIPLKATEFLQLCSWDMERAVQVGMKGGGGGGGEGEGKGEGA